MVVAAGDDDRPTLPDAECLDGAEEPAFTPTLGSDFAAANPHTANPCAHSYQLTDGRGCHDRPYLYPTSSEGATPVPAARLIYHPRRERRAFGSATVYFDSAAGNQDPYLWNDAFLHPY